MAKNIHAWFEECSVGTIDGHGSWPGIDSQEGKEGSSMILQFSHEVQMPRDPQSGQAMGSRTHKPVRLVKRIDKASPMLYQALTTAAPLKVTLKWYRHNADEGGEQHYFTTVLENANIVEVKEWFPMTLDSSKSDYSHMEDVAICYQTITWTWEDGGVTSTDDWLGAST
jgi:type VI secretion system secreted protein Hcp